MSVIYEDTNYGLKGFNELERAALEEGVCFASKNILEINNPAWSDRDYDEVMEDLIENEKAKGKSNGNIIGEVAVSCAIFCFKVPSRRTIVFTCLRLCQVKIYKFRHIMCNSRLHGTAVEFTVGCRKKNLKWHNLPQPWGKLCHHKGQVVSIYHVNKVYANALKVKSKCC